MVSILQKANTLCSRRLLGATPASLPRSALVPPPNQTSSRVVHRHIVATQHLRRRIAYFHLSSTNSNLRRRRRKALVHVATSRHRSVLTTTTTTLSSTAPFALRGTHSKARQSSSKSYMANVFLFFWPSGHLLIAWSYRCLRGGFFFSFCFRSSQVVHPGVRKRPEKKMGRTEVLARANTTHSRSLRRGEVAPCARGNAGQVARNLCVRKTAVNQ